MAILELADHAFRDHRPARDVPSGTVEPFGNRYPVGARQQRRVPARLGGQNSAHRHPDHRVGITRSVGVSRDTASGVRPLAAISRGL
ncbi:hypothetical protein Chelonae_p3393 [[Mycobacterium] chelonae subsp. bovistauri]|nr:hypothetical protein Chelonae_p3393 [Mycobacterium sp. QIA-37]